MDNETLYIYESHYGSLYISDELYESIDLYCHECEDYDYFLGEATTREEAWEVLNKKINDYGYDYIEDFIAKNWYE